MAGSNKDIDKKLNASAKPGGLPPAKNKHADDDAVPNPKGLLDELDSKLDDFFTLDDKDAKQAEKPHTTQSPRTATKPDGLPPAKNIHADDDAVAKPKGLLDELDSSLNDFFALEDKDVKDTEKRQIVPSLLDDVKATPEPPKTVTPDKGKGAKIKTKVPDAADKKGAVDSKPKTAAPAAVDSTYKPATPATKKPEIKAIDKDVSGQTKQKPLELGSFKPVISKIKSAPIPEKAPSAKVSKTQVPSMSVGSKIEPGKTDPRPGRKKHTLLKLTFGGIILAGGVLALLAFFQTPEPSRQSQTVAAPKAHKIIIPPVKAPETKPASPAVQTMPPQPKPAVSQPEVPPAAASADEKKPASPTTPATNPADEIKDFLQQWKTAWEKSAGAEGDTDALMLFYSEDFNSNGLDKKKWRQDKAEKNRIKKWIRIQVDNIHITGPLKDDRFAAGFSQVYQSSNYSDTSDQVLVLKKESSGWKIVGIKPQTPTSYPYSIHDGSYRTLAPAREAVEAYRQMGLEAYWASVDLGEKGIWYRVFIGYYHSRESAESIISDRKLKDVSPQETKYANLIGTYTSEDSMQSPLRLLLKKGYAPYVIMDADGNLNLYVGAYATSKGVEKFSAELNAKGIPSRAVER